jgi:hypothetical protein
MVKGRVEDNERERGQIKAKDKNSVADVASY